MNILYFVADAFHSYNSSRWRSASQAKMIRQSTAHDAKILGMTHWQRQTPLGLSYSAWADVIVLQRTILDGSLQAIKKWMDFGKIVILDYDDDYFRIPSDNSAYDFWGKGLRKDGSRVTPHPIVQFTAGIETVSAVSTPSILLSNDAIQTRGARCSLFVPNLLDLDITPAPTNRNVEKGVITFVWGGSMSHTLSWQSSGILPAMCKLLTERPNVKLRIFGDERIMRFFDSVPNDKVRFLPYVPYHEWGATLQRNGDVGLAPLAGEYDCRRSNIKLVEYTSMGIPFVATSAHPYVAEIAAHHGEDSGGVFVDQGEIDKADVPNPNGWWNALNNVVDNFDTFKSCAMSRAGSARELYGLNTANVDKLVAQYDMVLNSYCN